MQRSPATALSVCDFFALKLAILVFAALSFSIFSFAATPDRVTGPVAGQLIKLPGGVPLKAQAQYDQGPVDPALKLSYMTLLTVPSASQQEALKQLVAQQQERSSPLYHQWLTPEQYADQFGLSSNDIQKLTAWLQAQGFSVQSVARARNYIVFSGTAAQAESVFQTQIHNFKANGQTNFSNITSPSIPAALYGVVSGIRGLSNFRAKSYLQHRTPKYTYPTNDGDEYFLAPADIATIYDLNPLYELATPINGTNQTLAVVGQTDVYLSDINDFRSGFGLSTIPTTGVGSCNTDASGLITPPCVTANFAYVLVNADPGTTTSADDLGESDLDIEWSGAVAQNAQIIFVNAPEQSGTGVWDAWYYAVDNNVSKVITMSYGGCELGEAQDGTSGQGTFTSDEAELTEANTEGITFMNSSGDSGAAACDPPNDDPNELWATLGLAVSYPASSPEVTGVGGTALTITETNPGSPYWNNGTTGGSAVSYIPEGAWNDIQEIGAFCGANPGDCNDDITNAQTAQAYLGVRNAGGGGPSGCYTINASGSCTGGFPQPSYQSGLSISGQSAVRFVPDVAMLASPDLPGYIFCSDGSCAGGIAAAVGNLSVVGGTSAASPVFAGIVTLMNQYVVQNGLQAHPGFGNLNPGLYRIATYYDNEVTSSLKAFNSVTASDFAAAPGSNQVYCTAGTPASQPGLVCPAAVKPATEGLFGYLSSAADATTGYNLVTGLGSVDANNLATAVGDLYVATTATLSSGGTTQIFLGQSVTLTVAVTSPSKPGTAAGVASFTNNGSAYGNPITVTSGTGTLNISQLPAGNNKLIASYTGMYTNSTSNSVTVNVVAPTFTLAAANTTLTVAQGATAGPDAITVTSSSPGFVTGGVTAVALTYSCSGLPSESACSFTPSSSTTAAVSVSITTTAPSTGQLHAPLGRSKQIFYAMLLPGLFGIVLTVCTRKRAARGLRLLGLIVVLGVSTLWLASCGGGGSGGGGGQSNPGTPQGTYPITINATTAGGTAGTAAAISLTVN